MQIFIMRHGEAEGFAELGNRDDSQRVLTKQGVQEAQVMSSWMQKSLIKPTHIFVSPYIRAQQTSVIATSTFTAPIDTLDIITPSGDAKHVHDYIDGWVSDELNSQSLSLLIISHMPLVSYLVGELTQFDSAPIFSPAAIAHIDYDIHTMKGKLLSLVTPLDLC